MAKRPSASHEHVVRNAFGGNWLQNQYNAKENEHHKKRFIVDCQESIAQRARWKDSPFSARSQANNLDINNDCWAAPPPQLPQ